MSVKYRVTAVTGSYKDREGNDKKRYLDIGVVLETQNGLMLKLEAIPVGFEGFAYLNEPRERDAAPQRKTSGRPMRDEFSDSGLPDF